MNTNTPAPTGVVSSTELGAIPKCENCRGLGYTDAWDYDGNYNPTHCDECVGGRKQPNTEAKGPRSGPA